MTPKDILQLDAKRICLKKTGTGMHTNIQPTG